MMGLPTPVYVLLPFSLSRSSIVSSGRIQLPNERIPMLCADNTHRATHSSIETAEQNVKIRRRGLKRR
jgi:hypothetical protein